jgi:AcrR family transcriptional regulator
MTDRRTERKRRANGEESRRRILDAAAEVAGERGYEGTSIALVSAKCGLPASSIYWHFKNKDDLIAAVIERSFDTWLGALTMPDDDSGSALEGIRAIAEQTAKTLLDSPDFLRLGLMLTLERRPEEPSARRMFLRVRATARDRLAAMFAAIAPGADRDRIDLLTTYAIAGADGLFIAKEIGGDAVDLPRLFEVHARALYDTLTRLTASGGIAS